MAVIGEEKESAPQRNMSAYQIHSLSSSLPQGVVMTNLPGSLHSPKLEAEEISSKKELRLLKNRMAARACRHKRIKYVRNLEHRIAELELENKNLNNQIKCLKEANAAKSR